MVGIYRILNKLEIRPTCPTCGKPVKYTSNGYSAYCSKECWTSESGNKISREKHIETNLKSEFTSKGINQTLHRVYLDVNVKVSILTPFKDIEKACNLRDLLIDNDWDESKIPKQYFSDHSNSEGKYGLFPPACPRRSAHFPCGAGTRRAAALHISVLSGHRSASALPGRHGLRRALPDPQW